MQSNISYFPLNLVIKWFIEELEYNKMILI